MNNVINNLSEQPVLVEDGLCSRFRCTQSGCSACADVCPFPGAVNLAEQGVEVTGTCVGCGVCVPACPNGAIKLPQSDQRLAERLRDRVRPSAPLRISCERAEVQADIVLPCLGRLTEAILLEPIRCEAERVELLAPDCSGCQLEKAAPQWRKVLTLSSELCETAGFGADRVVRGEVPKPKPEFTHDFPDSRRALFRDFAKWTTKTTAEATPDDDPEQASAELFRDIVQRHQENPKRSHLLEVLRTLPGAKARSKVIPAAGTPLANLEVTPKCTGCNVCETLCPVGALRHSEENGTYALDFDPALCTGCRVCKAVCFHKAIRIRETVDLTVLFERRNVTLIRSTQRTCLACNETFLDDSPAMDDSPKFCPICLVSDKRRNAVARNISKRFLPRGNQRD